MNSWPDKPRYESESTSYWERSTSSIKLLRTEESSEPQRGCPILRALPKAALISARWTLDFWDCRLSGFFGRKKGPNIKVSKPTPPPRHYISRKTSVDMEKCIRHMDDIDLRYVCDSNLLRDRLQSPWSVSSPEDTQVSLWGPHVNKVLPWTPWGS
jgi:hypothetical protein